MIKNKKLPVNILDLLIDAGDYLEVRGAVR